MSEERLKLAQELARIGSWELDILKDELWWSDEVYRLFDLQPDEFEVTYESFLEHIHPDDREMVNDAYTLSLKTKKSYEISHRLKLRDGCIKYVVEKCKTYFNEEGKPIKSIGTVQDITESINTQEELINSEQRLKLATDAGKVGVFDWDIINNILVWDKSMYKLYGVNRADFKGAYEAWENVVHPEDKEQAVLDVQQALSGEKEFNTEFRIIKPDGEVRIIKGNANVFRNRNGEAERMVGVNLDITDQKKVENELKHHKENLEELVRKRTEDLENANLQLEEEKHKAQKYLDIAGVIMLVLDAQQNIRLINKKGCEIFGYVEEEIIGKNWYDLSRGGTACPKERQQFDDIISGKMELVRYNENEITTSTGKKRLIAWNDTLIYDSSGNITGMLSSGEDITEREKAEKGLFLSEMKNTALLQAIPDMIFQVTADGTYLDFIPAKGIEPLVPPEVFLGKKMIDVLPHDLAVSQMDNIKETLKKGEITKSEYTFEEESGPRHYEARFIPLGEKEVLGIAQDITERKNAEKELQDRARELETINKAMIDREMRIIEMKEEVNKLSEELDKDPPYPPLWQGHDK